MKRNHHVSHGDVFSGYFHKYKRVSRTHDLHIPGRRILKGTNLITDNAVFSSWL